MSGTIVLKFVYPPEDSGSDMRTVQIKQVDENTGSTVDIYKVRDGTLHPYRCVA